MSSCFVLNGKYNAKCRNVQPPRGESTMVAGGLPVENGNLHEAVRSLYAPSDVPGVIRAATERVRELVDARRVYAFLCDPEWEDLHWLRADNGTDGAEDAGTVRFAVGQGIAGYVAETGGPRRVADTKKDTRFIAAIDAPDGADVRSILSLPLTGSSGRPQAVIHACDKAVGTFSDEDETRAMILAGHAATALEKARALASSEELVHSLAAAVAGAIDGKHVETVGHCERVRQYAMALGREMGLEARERKALELAALLHDLGRMELTASEGGDPEALRRQQNHVLFTDAILRNVDFPDGLGQVVDIALAHHEHLDGSGYPKGLDRDHLGLPARILMVANTYDQIQTRTGPDGAPGRSEEDACVRLQVLAESTLDKDVVDTFVRKKLYRIERRRFPRTAFQTPVDVHVVNADSSERPPIETDVLDVSEGGLMFYCDHELPVMSLVRMVIHLPTDKIEALGRVARVLADDDGRGCRVGVHFIWFETVS